jgi:hypothetical protein
VTVIAIRSAKAGLFTGSLGSCAMGTYHFFLPYAWRWDRPLQSLPPTLQWGSHAINFFMSYLMLAGGVLTFAAFVQLRAGRRPGHGAVAAMGSFWLVNTAYQLIIPMPLPDHLFPLRLALLGYAAVVAAAHAVAFVALWQTVASRGTDPRRPFSRPRFTDLSPRPSAAGRAGHSGTTNSGTEA